MPSSRGPGRGWRRRRKAKLARLPALHGQFKPMTMSLINTNTQHHPNPDHHFIPTESDLESDEAVWDLYDRWCLQNVNRTPEQRRLRFSYFKQDAIEVVELNKKYPSDPRSLTGLADSTDKERNLPPV